MGREEKRERRLGATGAPPKDISLPEGVQEFYMDMWFLDWDVEDEVEMEKEVYLG